MNLFATVRDKKTKQIVPTLDAGRLPVSEDGKEQKISFFSKESKLPITLGMLIDTSGSEQYTLGAEQDAAAQLPVAGDAQGRPRHVISFDTDADLLADFTDDHAALDRAIRRARINAPGALGPLANDPAGTVFYDAVYLACPRQAGRRSRPQGAHRPHRRAG